ncbi:MAG: transposase [SAR324 cluster bacterium]|nr:transposase [SAR324 cluster bacterium]
MDWTIRALRVIRRWEPACGILLLVDGGFSSFELLEECCRLHISIIYRLRIDAKLYEFPPEPVPGKRGPKPKKGALRPSLSTLAKDDQQPWKKATLAWYQVGEKNISYISGVALMYKANHIPIAVKWVLVRVEGKKNPQAFLAIMLSLRLSTFSSAT